MLKKLAVIGLATAIAFGPIVVAPMAAMGADAPATPAKPVLVKASAKAQECSREAEAKGLQGKPRKKFLAECKKSCGLSP